MTANWVVPEDRPMDATVADRATAVHRALASETRQRIVDRLRSAGDPVDASRLADELDMHVTTVRSHLAVLERAGLVQSRPIHTGRPGRPAVAWAVSPQARDEGRVSNYRLLAQILIDGLADGSPVRDRSAWAQSLGERWAPRLLASMGLAEEPDALAAVHESFERLGFSPHSTASEMRLHACPFGELAVGHEDIVCDLHLGMARGMFREHDAEVDAGELTPFMEPSLCVLELVDRRTTKN